MSDGHGGDGACGAGLGEHCADPVAGPAEAAAYAEAPQAIMPVVNGVEISRATILDKSKISRSESK